MALKNASLIAAAGDHQRHRETKLLVLLERQDRGASTGAAVDQVRAGATRIRVNCALKLVSSIAKLSLATSL